MIKNTASQVVGAQMVSATDGSAFTGSVTVRVTGDGGTQATGSVGSGACTHEGNGYHTYAPAQAETNYDLIAFTFTGTGAIPVTVQVYTVAGDAFTRLGAPAGASVSADILTLDNLVDDLEGRLTSARAGYLDNLSAGAVALQSTASAIETDTQDIQGRLPSALVSGRIDASVGAMAANVMTAAAAASDLTTELQSGLATAAAVSTLQTSVDDLPTNAELATSQAAADDATLAAIAALNNVSTAQVQTAAAAALTAYDPPTNAEMEARTLTAAQIAKLVAHLTGVLTVIVGSGSTTTSVVLNASTGINGGAPSSTNDHYNGRVLVFISGALAGQATDITDYVGSSVTMTVTALTGAPSAADTAILV